MNSFVPADPAVQRASLDAGCIHVWRMPYQPSMRRAPFLALLSAYLDIDPSTLQLIADAHGRPWLADASHALSFNWSHSGEHAVCALARSLPLLGVDFEAARPRTRALDLARRYFHTDEHDDLLRVSPVLRESAFLRTWTAKEAVLKAFGEGIRYGLDRVIFNITADSARPRRIDGPAGPADAWHMSRLDDAHGMSCVAWKGSHRDVHWFTPSSY